jgi:hypothetical protein
MSLLHLTMGYQELPLQNCNQKIPLESKDRNPIKESSIEENSTSTHTRVVVADARTSMTSSYTIERAAWRLSRRAFH